MFKMKEIHTLDVEWDGTEAWLICAYTNILFKFDSVNLNYEFVAMLPENGVQNYSFHSQCVKYGKLVYCLPKRGQDIYIYDISLKEFRKIILGSADGEGANIDKLCVREEILYTISYGFKQIIKIDMKAEKIIDRLSVADDSVSLYKAICCDNKVYAILNNKSGLLQVDLDKSLLKFIYLDDEQAEEKGFTTIGFAGGQVWLCGYDNKLYMWKIDEEKISRYFELPKDIKFFDFTDSSRIYLDKGDTDYYFGDCISYSDSVWFIPYRTNKLLYVKTGENVIRELFIEDEEETVESMRRQVKRKYAIVKKDTEKYFVLKSYKNCCYYKVNVDKETVEKICAEVTYGNLDELRLQYGNKNEVMSEEIAIDRNLYVNEIFCCRERQRTGYKEGVNIGEDIYSLMCK